VIGKGKQMNLVMILSMLAFALIGAMGITLLIPSLFRYLYTIGCMAANAIFVNITSNTTTVGAVIDTQGYVQGLIDFVVGEYTDGTYTCYIYDSDAIQMEDEAGISTTAGKDCLATTYPVVLTAAGKASVEVFFKKRYFRVKIVSTDITTGAYVGAIAHLAPVQSGGPSYDNPHADFSESDQ